MDQLKKLGITVGQPNLAPITKSLDEQIADSIKKGGMHAPERRGVEDDFRARLEKSLAGSSQETISKAAISRPVKPARLDITMNVGAGESNEADKGSNEGLKNAHGEEFHSDNDKQVEKLVTEVAEIDRIYDTEKEERKFMVTRSLSREELFLKASDEGFFIKSDKKAKKGALVEWAKEEEAEHAKEKGVEKACHSDKFDRCVRKVSKEKGKDSAYAICTTSVGKSLAVIDELFEDIVKARHPIPPVKPSTRAPRQEKDPEQKREERAARRALGVKSEDGEDKLIETVPEKPVRNLAKLHENSPGMRSGRGGVSAANALLADNARKSFIKSAGPGGLMFDFGGVTGNPIADRATALLNQHSDPVQAANAAYVQESYQKALGDFVTKGEQEYAQTATPFGHVQKDNARMLDKSFDQQVEEAFKKGELDNQPGTPAVKNEFNKTEMKLGGQVVKATSETDAALIEMMKAQGVDLSGMDLGANVADATAGGKQKITIDAV